MNEGKRRWLLVGLIALAFALRVIGLDAQSLWRDEIDAIRFASRPLDDMLHMFASPGQNGPLFYLLLRPWLDLAGRSGVALRFFSVLFGTLAVPLVYRLGRRLFPSLHSLAIVAAFLVSTSPYLIWYSQEGKMYALVVALVLLSMDRYLAALDRGGWHRWLLYVAFTAAAIYVHLIAALMVPAQALIFLLLSSDTRRARWKPWLASMAVLTLPYLPLLAWQLPMLLAPGSTGYSFVPLHRLLGSLLINYSQGVLYGGTLWTTALFVGLLLAAGLLLTEGLLWKERRACLSSLAVLTCWLLVPVFSFFLITLVRPMYTARYLIFVLPAFVLFLSAGLVAIARRSRLLAGLWLVTLLLVTGWGTWKQASTPVKADFRAATDYLVGRLEPDDLLLFQIPYGRFSFDYYYQFSSQPNQLTSPPQSAGGDFRAFLPLVAGGGEPYRWAEGLYTNAGMDPVEVDSGMQRITAQSSTVWLIATEVSLWDERRMVQNWLDTHATPASEAGFVGVTVYGYELP